MFLDDEKTAQLTGILEFFRTGSELFAELIEDHIYEN